MNLKRVVIVVRLLLRKTLRRVISLGYDWYRVRHEATDTNRDYKFSAWLYKNFGNDDSGITLCLHDFKESVEKESDEFKAEFKDTILLWLKELEKISEGYDENYYDFHEC